MTIWLPISIGASRPNALHGHPSTLNRDDRNVLLTVWRDSAWNSLVDYVMLL